MRTLNYRHWTAISFLLLFACVALNVALSDDIQLLAAFVLPPLVAGLSTTPRRTAMITALSIVAVIGIGAEAGNLFTTSHSLRAAVVIITAILAIQTSILRERDLRTRRRLALINVARSELDAASGLEDDLASFARAASLDFAEWAFLDLRLPDDSTSRIVTTQDRNEQRPGHPVPRRDVTSASTSYEVGVQREGPMLMRGVNPELCEALFTEEPEKIVDANLIVVPVSVGDLKATYFLVCPEPHPPWGAAELTQVESLARGAALKARSDQLIDRISFAQQELRESRDEVAAIVQGIADGVVAQDAEGNIVYANEKSAEMLGFGSADELIGTHFSAVPNRMDLRDEAGNPFDANNLPSRRALAGEEEPTAVLRYELYETGQEWWTLVKSTPVRDAAGKPILAITLIEDQTEQRREAMAQRFLAAASKSLSESLDYDSAIQSIADAAVPDMADWCTIEMVSSSGGLETVAVAHENADQQDQVMAFRQQFPFSDESYGPPQVVKTGVAELFDQLSTDRLQNLYEDEERLKAAEALLPRSSLVAPITVHGQPIGTITMALVRAGSRFSEHDLDTAIELGRRAGITLDNARLHTERMRMLASLQKSLIPATLPTIEGLSLTARFRPAEVDAEVGGDFYDVFALPDGSTGLVIGDVCGKGPEAAAITALARYTIRAAAMNEVDPQAILHKLNDALLEQVTDGRFATVAFMRLIKNGEHGLSAEIVSGGHPLPLLIGGEAPVPLGEPGTLLGVVENPDLPVFRATIPPLSAVVLYTDGLSAGQSTDDTAFAANLIRDIHVNGNADLAAEIDQAAHDTQLEPNRDDVAILVARVLG